MSGTDASMNQTLYNNILKGNKMIQKSLYKNVNIKAPLSNHSGYNNYLKGRNGLLSKIITLSASSLSNDVRKNAKHLDYSQYIRYKNYRAKAPRFPVLLTTTTKVNSPETVLITADGAGPTANTVDNCWSYVNTGSPDKINWYFYADGGFALDPPSTYKFSDLECFYFLVKLNNPLQINKEFNKPWITIYSQPKYDGKDASWYRSRWNYSGFYDNGNTPSNNLESGTYVFYVGNYDVLYNKDSLNIYQRYNLNDYVPNSPLLVNHPNNLTPENDGLWLIALSSDSNAAPGTFDICLKEVGYKIKNKPTEIIKTTA